MSQGETVLHASFHHVLSIRFNELSTVRSVHVSPRVWKLRSVVAKFDAKLLNMTSGFAACEHLAVRRVRTALRHQRIAVDRRTHLALFGRRLTIRDPEVIGMTMLRRSVVAP